MSPTLRVLFSHWRRHKLQLAICLLGITLGVAVVTAMDIANASALRSFRQSISEVTGRATHQIAPAEGSTLTGVPDELFASIVRNEGIKAAPVIESHGILLADPDAELAGTPREEREARAANSEQKATHGTRDTALVRIIGIDPLSDQPFRPFDGVETRFYESTFNDWAVRDDACVLPETLAKRLGVKLGDRLAVMSSGRRHKLTLVGTYVAQDRLARGSDDVLLMDIAAVQERFGQAGVISHIDLIVPDDAAATARLDGIAKTLPSGLVVQRPSDRAGRTEALLSAFQLNLTALSLLALVVGTFLIHNTLTVAVLQRSAMIGTLRCLGQSSAGVRRAVLLEALLLGFVGSLFGLFLGTQMAALFLQRVGGVVSDLYAHVGAFSVFLTPASLAKGMALGLFASVAGAWFPAREAASVAPVQVLRRSRIEYKAQSSWKLFALFGSVALLISLGLAMVPGSSPVPGLAAAFALALGGALWSPAITRWFSFLIARPLRAARKTVAMLAARGMSANLSRTGLAVGALALALSMTLGVAIMVSSFRSTLDRWMEQAINADLYIRPAGPSLLRLKLYMPEETIAGIAAMPQVAAVDPFIGRELGLDANTPVMIVATDLKTTFSRGHTRFPFYKGDPDAALAGVLNGGIMISESLSRKKNLNVGDSLTIPGSRVPEGLRIVAIYYEYATERGVITMDRTTYKKVFGDDRINSCSVYLKPGTDLEAAQAEVRRRFGVPGGLYVFSNAALREEAFTVFDRTFAITRQLESLSLAVGLCGILSALIALLRERSTDFALMRALGLSGADLSRMIVCEGLLLGCSALLVAFVLGPALALLLIHVINVRAFGWTIFMALDPWVFVRVASLALLMSALAGVYPSLRGRRLSISAALRQE
ncbi:MAG TPA: FtsX-like permease family protein [Planctomycetota bacterium]|nr:FtsX-like permease family protein [Planctomycetota bacterium]